MTTPALFYPIVPDVTWLKRLLPLGVRTVQLRIKNVAPEEMRRQIGEAVPLARAAGCQLIINDAWQAAIDAGAPGVHLGQEDLADADLKAIQRAGIALGISTHDERELDIALAARPAYVALGPIYETKLKAMAYSPQGLERVAEWKRRIGDLPLVAIGGITPERAQGVVAAGADSVAVITDFMSAPHPEARVRLWLDWAESMSRDRESHNGAETASKVD
jgi:thiamine-phosphate pyrophosphorylase